MIPDWLDLISAVAGGSITVVGALVLMLKPGRLVLRVLRAVEGEPGRPGLLDQMKDQTTKIETIQHQVLPNGGASLRDAVARTERSSGEALAISRASAERVQTLAERLDRHIESRRD